MRRQYSLAFAPAAGRQWDKLIARISPEDYEALESALESLAGDPRPPKAQKLYGERHAYRVRVGDYRIIHHVDDSGRSIVVAKVARRSERTYRRLN